ncbi:hypothetical protein [Sphingobacterium siyangense]|uniref:hypothetical protein n=1 Tax=Sphingobacterium siyangense TaxID=459529 RepID=UPI003DA4A0D2
MLNLKFREYLKKQMNISTHHIDSSGKSHNRNFRMSKLAFIKHLAIAGQAYSPSPQKLFRTIGMLLHYSHYMQSRAFNAGRFSEPPITLSDPTEKAQFSNLAGKAIADFLSKRIDNSLFTVNYESAMRIQGHKLKGQRPDLIAYTQNSIFAIEAKGRHQPNSGNMTVHKAQSQTGPIPVNFSIACVSYNLFNNVACNYHDPFIDNIEYDNTSLGILSRNYYKGILEFLNSDGFDFEETEIQGEKFYAVGLSRRNYEKFFFDWFPFRGMWELEFFHFLKPKLIIPYRIREYSEVGISNHFTPFLFESNGQSDYIYIDNDRIGLSLSR